jgi:hypothetical protein
LIARERLLARVYAQVIGEVMLETKRFETHFAHEILGFCGGKKKISFDY